MNRGLACGKVEAIRSDPIYGITAPVGFWFGERAVACIATAQRLAPSTCRGRRNATVANWIALPRRPYTDPHIAMSGRVTARRWANLFLLLVHYEMVTASETRYYTLWLTADGDVADFISYGVGAQRRRGLVLIVGALRGRAVLKQRARRRPRSRPRVDVSEASATYSDIFEHDRGALDQNSSEEIVHCRIPNDARPG